MKTQHAILFFLLSLLAVGCSQENIIKNPGAQKYIVVLKAKEVQLLENHLRQHQSIAKQDVVRTMTSQLAVEHTLQPAKLIYSAALEGGVYELTNEQADKLAQDPRVDFIEKDQQVHVSAVQGGAVWGLDRIDQIALPLNQSYSYPSGGYQVNVYVIDTGILTSHSQFQGRASSAMDLVGNDYDATDCNGHGTHVAGTIGGSTYGVAKNARLYAVRVLDCDGSGSYSQVIAGVDWVTRHHKSPAVANMSLGGPISQALDNAVRASIRSGVTYALAAGNENSDACQSSPSRVWEALVVGSSTVADTRSSFSNYGSCVSLFAPGSDITSTWIGSNYATNTISGTSMATPHVAGVAALYLSQYPSASPEQVKSALVNSSTSNRLSGVGAGSPNSLLNTQFLGSSDN